MEILDLVNYAEERHLILKHATDWIKDIRPEHDEELVVVLDIDETALVSRLLIHHKPRGKFSSDEIQDDIAKGGFKAIAETLEFYNQCIKNGIKIVFLTGRPEYQRKVTVNNLIEVGYTRWKELHLKSDLTTPTIEYKSQVRRKIERSGAVIIANVGDQDSDFIGGHNGKIIKLPNPFYSI